MKKFCKIQLLLVKISAKIATLFTMAKLKKKEISLKVLLEAGCHFGHQSRRWNPKMKPYLYDIRDGVHIFDLASTKEKLQEAYEFLRSALAEGRSVIFVGSKRQAKAIVSEEAKKAKIPYISQRWIGGTITNWDQINKSIKKLVEMREKRSKGEYKKYTKKEQILLDREINRLEKFFGGLVGLEKAPEILFVVDVKKEEAAVKEARIRGITVVAIVDSDSDPNYADYLIPCNDDAVGSIKLVVSLMAEAVREGKELYNKKSTKKSK